MDDIENLDPIWDYLESHGIKISWLAGQIGYAANHLYAVKAKRIPSTARFRRRCATVLDQSEGDLFNPANDPEKEESEEVARV